MHAIDNEFSICTQDDDCRLSQVRCQCAKNGHPFGKFGWGNLKSLTKVPQKAGKDLRAEMLAFHQEHYRAPRMRLVVLGYDPLDELQDMVVRVFGDAGVCCLPCEPSFALKPSTKKTPAAATNANTNANANMASRETTNRMTLKSAPPPMPPPVAATNSNTNVDFSFAKFGAPFSPESLTHICCVVPVKQMHSIHLTWQLHSVMSAYLTKPEGYISHALGHEGPGSLYSALRRLGLCTSLCCGVGEGGEQSSTAFALMQCEIKLTSKGMERWAEVISMVGHSLTQSNHTIPKIVIVRENISPVKMKVFSFCVCVVWLSFVRCSASSRC